jgi:hypothetical protein
VLSHLRAKAAVVRVTCALCLINGTINTVKVGMSVGPDGSEENGVKSSKFGAYARTHLHAGKIPFCVSSHQIGDDGLIARDRFRRGRSFQSGRLGWKEGSYLGSLLPALCPRSCLA